jgi:hypothetical protein
MSDLADYMPKNRAKLIEREIFLIIETMNLDRMLTNDNKIKLFYDIIEILCSQYHGRIK